MAITKVTRTLLSTGIVDNSNATAITIDSSENVGIGTSSPTKVVHVKASSDSSGTPIIGLSPTATDNIQGGIGCLAGGEFQLIGTNQTTFYTNGSETMRIDISGNVGIGTTSPALQSGGTGLHINGSSYSEIKFTNSSTGTAATDGTALVTNSLDFGINNREAGKLTFGTSNSTRMTIDSSGNVGIGTTNPSASLQVNVASDQNIGFQSVGGNPRISAYNDAVNTSLDLNFNGANLKFETGGVEAMRIESTGNISIGTTTSTAKVNIAANSADGSQVRVYGATNENYQLRLGFDTTNLVGKIQAVHVGTAYKDLILQPEGANVGIGTSSPTDSYNYGKTLDIHGSTGAVTYLRDSDATSNFGFLAYDGGTTNRCVIGGGGIAYLRFISAGAECGRFDNEGNFLIGKTTHNVNNTQGVDITTEGAVVATNDGGVSFLANRTGSDGQTFLFRRQNVTVGSISVTGSATTYATSSDYRLKENVDYDFTALDRVAQLKPARFNFIATPTVTVDGFVAHEVQDIVPEAIIGEKDAVDDEGNPEYQGIDQSKLVPLLTKAIQELSDKVDNQQTIIDDLKTRIETLENA